MSLIRRLLAFSRQQPAQPELVDLDRIIEDLRPMLQGLAEGAVELAIRSDGKLWPVSIDPAQVEQVVVNLLLNAREASPGGGHVTFSTVPGRGTTFRVYLPRAVTPEAVIAL
jgi:two-component system cell cycle sensor histidine kinase/response regulator CckA